MAGNAAPASDVRRQTSDRPILAAVLASMLLFFPATSFAEPPLTLSDAWVRAVPPVSANTAGYFILHNAGEEALTLTGLNTPLAAAGELHEMAEQADGTRRMRRLSEVPVPAGESVHFRPGGKHLMLFRLTGPLEEGREATLCLEFAEREPFCGTFLVRR